MLLGDDHVPDTAQVADTWLTYCGSTERASADEREDRRYNIVTFDDDVQISRRGLDTREFVFCEVELAEDEGVSRVREAVGQYDLTDAVVIVHVDGDGEPVTPASVEEFALEAGALVARVTDHRELADDREVEVNFADPDDAVRERVRELGLSEAARDIDETIRASKVASSNVADEVESHVRENSSTARTRRCSTQRRSWRTKEPKPATMGPSQSTKEPRPAKRTATPRRAIPGRTRRRQRNRRRPTRRQTAAPKATAAPQTTLRPKTTNQVPRRDRNRTRGTASRRWRSTCDPEEPEWRWGLMRFTRIRVENFKRYADADLRLDRGVTVIHGLNGSGKSSLLEACFFALYGSKALDETLEDVVSIGAEDAEVELWFTHAGGDYHVERRVRVRDERAVTAKAVLETPEGTYEGARAVRQRVTDLLRMDHEAFVNCAYVRQGEVNKLINASPASARTCSTTSSSWGNSRSIANAPATPASA